MDRREFIGLGLALMAPRAGAQQAPGLRRIGVLGGGTLPKAFLADEMAKYGWVEGQNLIIERRSAEGDAKRARLLAVELVRLNMEVIVTIGAVCSLAGRDATQIIPIVSVTGDPVLLGLVQNLSHPGGNITGVTSIAPELAAKRLEILRALLPNAVMVAELVDPANEYIRLTRSEYEQALRKFGMRPVFVDVPAPTELSRAFEHISRQRAEALIIRGDPVFISNRDEIVRRATQLALPTIAEGRQFVEAGALASYAAKLGTMRQRQAAMVDRILRGAKPADLPIEQPSELELVINLKAARALGLTIPQPLLLRADEVIQ
jgi:putative ABC transport system substrate-binding protein